MFSRLLKYMIHIYFDMSLLLPNPRSLFIFEFLEALLEDELKGTDLDLKILLLYT